MARGLKDKAEVAARLVRRRSKRWEQQALAACGRPPVLVFSWSKTGSSTVYETLRHARLWRPVHHVHELDDALEARLEQNRLTGRDLGLDERSLGLHQRLRAAVQHASTHFDLVTLVRDPVSRAVSSFFQSYQRAGNNRMHATLGDDHGAALVEQLRCDLPRLITSTDNWFDRQLRPVFRIDAFEHPFDPDVGWSIVRTPLADQVTIRLDHLDEVFSPALEELLGARIRRLRNSNLGDGKPRSTVRRSVLEDFRLSDDEIDLALSTRTMQHYFDLAERDELARRWASGPLASRR